jgi:phenylacetate-CoA ligase
MLDQHLTPQDIKVERDLAKLPILTKNAIRAHGTKLIAENTSMSNVTCSKTGGTTGEPIWIYKDKECGIWGGMCFERGLGWGGLQVDERRISLFGGSLGFGKASLATRLGNALRRDLFLPAFQLRADTATTYFERIRQSKARFIRGYASSIYRLAVLAAETNQKIQFEAAFPTAELMLPEWEAVIRKAFDCAVLPYYGSGEVNSLGYSHPAVGTYLVPEEHTLIEILRPDKSAHLTGEGQFLITDLDNYAMPIIRYANGDAGKIRDHGECGLPFARIERLDGRYNSLLMTDKGDLISGVIGTHVFRNFSTVRSYQVIQEEPLRVVIKIVPKGDFSEKDGNLITHLFSTHLGDKTKVTIERVADIPVPPSGKSVFVINRCL